ncbi:hypothetical protein MTO96_005338 [Rhipicephalus appendiculatus]
MMMMATETLSSFVLISHFLALISSPFFGRGERRRGRETAAGIKAPSRRQLVDTLRRAASLCTAPCVLKAPSEAKPERSFRRKTKPEFFSFPLGSFEQDPRNLCFFSHQRVCFLFLIASEGCGFERRYGNADGLLLATAYSEDGKGEETLDTEGHSFGSLGQASNFRQAGNFLQAAPTYGRSTTVLSRSTSATTFRTSSATTSSARRKATSPVRCKGTYGYTDSYGVYRKVHYVADQNGFRADIKTNEPGVKQENPADVQLVVEPAPQGVLQQALTGSRSAGFAKLPAAAAPGLPRFPSGLNA